MHILCVGLSHQTAPVELREKLAMNDSQAAAAMSELAAAYPGAELAILSTCNRTEFYIARPLHGHPRLQEITGCLARRAGVEAAALSSCLYHHDNERAVRHLMRVTGGLDSMVLGENQILGQVRAAYDLAQQTGTVGSVLHRLFQASLAAGKTVRAQTGIGSGRTSVSSVAVDFARHLFSSFADKTVLAIGAGKMTELTLRHFMELRPKRLLVCNRTFSKAADLAGKFAGRAVPFESLDDHLIEADVVISSTGATQPIVTAACFKPLLKPRRFRPVFIIDIAMPRDFDPAVGDLSNVYLYNLDDLQKVIAEQAAGRSGQIGAAEAIIEPAVVECYAQVQTGDFAQLIRRLRDQLHAIGDAESQRALQKLRTADESRLQQALEEYTHRLINKILHKPLTELNKGREAGGAEAALYATALRRLFDLDREAEDLKPPESRPADAPAPRDATKS